MLTKSETSKLKWLQSRCLDKKTGMYKKTAKPEHCEEIAVLIARRDAEQVNGPEAERKTGPEKLLDSMNSIIDAAEEGDGSDLVHRTVSTRVYGEAVEPVPAKAQKFVDQGYVYIGKDSLGIMHLKDEKAVYSINKSQGKYVPYRLSELQLWSPKDFENLLKA